MKTEKTSVSRDNINLDEMFIFESTTDEDSLSAATMRGLAGRGTTPTTPRVSFQVF